MSNRYNGRSGFSISRDNYDVESSDKAPSWFDEYAKNLEKSAVKSRSEDYSMFNQINDMLSGKSKYSSVEEAVLDMRRRTGLDQFMNKKAHEHTHEHKNPEIFKDIPELKVFIDNYIEDRPGTSVEAVVHNIMRVKSIRANLPQGEDLPDDVKHYINQKIKAVDDLELNEKESLDLGKLDVSVDENVASDNDPFSGCTPNKK